MITLNLPAFIAEKMRRITTVIILLIYALYLQAQSDQWTIAGKVVDNRTGETIDYANVLLFLAKDSTMVSHTATQTDGSFTFGHNQPGDYYLVVSFIGYQTLQTSVTLSNSQRNINMGSILLEQSRELLSEVEILGKRRQIVYRLDKQVIEASSYLSAAGGTAVDILARTPSFRVDAEGELTFRGSSGFKVYIDGKPATLDGSAALEQIPAGQIDNIEVITNPSARYEADGTAGIINVITKKQVVNGWSGLLTGMASTVASRSFDFMLSYRKDDIRWQTSGMASRRYLISDFHQSKNIDTPLSDTITSTRSEGERKSYVDQYFLRTGLDWYKGKTTWSAAVEGRCRIRDRGGTLHYDDSYYSKTTGDTTYSSYKGRDFVRLDEWTIRGDIGFDHRFSENGHRLTGSFFAFYEGDAMEFFYTDLFHPDGSQAQGHRAWEDEYRFTAQGNLDYVRPFSDAGKFEAGYYFFTYTEDGDYTVDFFNPSLNVFERRDDLYNKFLFRRDIHALYAILSNRHGKFSYQAGLRGEYWHRKLGNSEEWARHTWNELDLFPSVHLSYTLNKEGRINMAYSRRITHPQLFYMEPYIVYVDYYTAQRGNPLILPEYTNSMEAGYSKGFGDNSVSAGLFHRMRRDKIERVRVPYHTGVTLDSMANVGNDYASGLELAAVLQLKNRWALDVNGSLYYYAIRNDYKQDGEDEESWNWQLAINNNFDIGKNTRMRLEAYYVGPSVSTQGRVDDFFYFNFSVRQQLFKRKLTATMNIRDVFATAKYVNTQKGQYLDSRTTIYPRSPLFTFTLAYTFNNFSSQKKEEKATHDLFEGTNR